MVTRRHDDDDDDAFGPDGLLKDGRKVRVSMMMRDASMRRGDAGSGMMFDCRHQPGFAVADQAGLDAKAQAYAEMVRALDFRSRPAAEDRREDSAAADALPRVITSDADRRGAREICDRAYFAMCAAMSARKGPAG